MLSKLDLSYCKLITDASVRLVWTHPIYIRDLYLSGCSLLTDKAFPAPVKPYSQLDAPNSTKNDEVELCPLVINRALEDLQILNLTACSRITDEAIEGIISHAPNIRHLILYYGNVSILPTT